VTSPFTKAGEALLWSSVSLTLMNVQRYLLLLSVALVSMLGTLTKPNSQFHFETNAALAWGQMLLPAAWHKGEGKKSCLN
jgi:hypothetical protein